MVLSIIIPAYNCEKYLPECLNSIIPEMNSFTEIILLNDGSTDGTYEICNKYASDNVKVFSNNNHGVAHTRNLGIQYASGKYLMFVDSDDILVAGWGKVVSKVIDRDEDIIYFSRFLIEKHASKKNILDNILGIPNEKKWGSLAGVYSKLFKREFILANQILFNEFIINGEDALFNIHALDSSTSFELIPESIYIYRVNYSSATHSFNDKYWESNLVFLKELEAYLSRLFELNSIDIDSYMEFCRTNGIYILIYRISLINDSDLRKEKLQLIKKYDIKGSLKYFKYNRKYELIINVFCILLKYNCNRFAVLLMRIINRSKQIIKKNSLWEMI